MRLQFLFASLLLGLCFCCSAQSFQWVGSMGGETAPVESEGGLSADAFGNVYIIGDFAFGAVDVDPGAGVHILTPTNRDAFVAKVDAQGDLIWAAHLTGNFFAWGIDVAATPEGGVVAVGHFTGNLDFDPSSNTHLVTAESDNDVFILKLSANGAFQWVRTFSTVSDYSQNQSHSVSVDPFGNIAFSGVYNGIMDVETKSGLVTLSSINEGRDYFLMHLSANGIVNWAKSIGTNQNEGGPTFTRTDVAMASDGSIIMIGELLNTIDFNPGGTGGMISPSSDQSIFLVRYNGDGSLNWVKKIGGEETAGWTELPAMGSVALDPDDNILVSSRITGLVELSDSIVVGEEFFYRSFVAKFNINGAAIWGRTMEADLSGVTVDAAGNVYCTGYTGNNANMDIFYSNTIATTTGSFAMPYLMQFNENGGFENLFVYDAPAPFSSQFGYGVAFGGNSIYTSGQLNATTNFSNVGNNTIASPNNINSATETYLVRYFADVPACTAAESAPLITALGSTTICLGDSITLEVNGSLNENAVWNWTEGADCYGNFKDMESVVTFAPTQSSVYSVNAIYGGCLPGPCTSIEITVEECVNVKNLDIPIGDLFFSYQSSVLSVYALETAWLKVYDIAGREVVHQNQVNERLDLNLSFLPAGVYIATLVNNNDRVILRFVK